MGHVKTDPLLLIGALLTMFSVLTIFSISALATATPRSLAAVDDTNSTNTTAIESLPTHATIQNAGTPRTRSPVTSSTLSSSPVSAPTQGETAPMFP